MEISIAKKDYAANILVFTFFFKSQMFSKKKLQKVLKFCTVFL